MYRPAGAATHDTLEAANWGVNLTKFSLASVGT